MASPIVIITTVESGIGFLLTATVFYLVLSRGRKPYHYLFAAFLFLCFMWDLGTFIMMIRNGHLEELPILGRIFIYPCIIIPALIFHFVNLYIERPIRWAIILIWIFTALTYVPILAGLFYQIEGTYSYGWGNIFRVERSFIDPLIFISWFGINSVSIWLMCRGVNRISSPVLKRHYTYIIAGISIITLSIVKALVTMGIDIAFLLPLAMFFNDVFASMIGLAIINDRLLDITVIVKKGFLFSLLAGVVIFIYSFVEHLLVTYVGEKVGEGSTMLHLISVGIGIAVLMPLKNRIEHAVEGYFTHRKLEF